MRRSTEGRLRALCDVAAGAAELGTEALTQGEEEGLHRGTGRRDTPSQSDTVLGGVF